MRRLLAAVFLAGSAHAAVLEAGADKPHAKPSDAIAAARDGDTVRVAAGEYADCAVIARNHFTLEAAGGPVTFRGRTCAGKAILVVAGDDVTIRGLTLADAHVPDGNGAGIRAEGGALRIDAVRFLNNENGLMSAAGPAMTIEIADSVFIGNGRCRPTCAHGIYAGHIALLRVTRSRFLGQHEGHHIKSRAARTEVLDCEIADGPDGDASYLIDLPNGGAASIGRNRMRKGPHSGNPAAAISIGAEGDTNPSGVVSIFDNEFINEQDRSTVFVRNAGGPVSLIGNKLTGFVMPLLGAGTAR